ncbi:Phenylcoumaran benzylic ether reductase Betv6 [Asimina triloba]
MAEKSKILIIGGTGYIGKFVVEASAKAGHPTYVLVRESTASNPDKAKIIENFKNHGVNLVYGDIYDHESLVKAIKGVDVVISTVGHLQLADQTKIIAAIKEAGNVKRFFPSEFGNDVDRVHAVEPAKTAFATKAQIRRAVEASKIPYTFVSSNFFAMYFLPTLAQSGVTSPPRDKVVILGDGNPRAVFVKEEDIGTYTIKAVDDPRTLNKILYLRPPANIYSMNDLVSLWEKKIGKTLERIYVPEEQVIKNIQESPVPVNIILSIGHSVFVKGDHTNFEIHPSFGVEASELYPDVKYTTVDEILRERPEKLREGERDFTMKKKEYKTYFLLPARRTVTVVDLLPVRYSKSDLRRKATKPECVTGGVSCGGSQRGLRGR